MSRLPDRIVSDLCMPNLHGIDRVKSLRRSPEYHPVPILGWTAPSNGHLHNNVKAGAPEAMDKPARAIESYKGRLEKDKNRYLSSCSMVFSTSAGDKGFTRYFVAPACIASSIRFG